MKALVLAAGYATRLYPLTENTPKPLLRIAGRPIINYIIDNLKSIKLLDEIFVVTNDKFYGHFKSWAKDLEQNSDFKKNGLVITVINDGTKTESSRIGAIGDIEFVIKNQKLKNDLLILGGDNLFTWGLEDFINYSIGHKPQVTIGLFDIKNSAQAAKYGVVAIDNKAEVVDFQEKPNIPNSTLVAMCLYYLPAEKLMLIRQYLTQMKSLDKKDASGNYIKWLYPKESVFAHVFRGHWYDIGDIDSYKDADSLFTRFLRIGAKKK